MSNSDVTKLPEYADKRGLCTRCGFNCGFTEVSEITPISWDRNNVVSTSSQGPNYAVSQLVTIMECQNCGNRIVVIEDAIRVNGRNTSKGVFWWPIPGVTLKDECIPEEIREAFSEATRALAANCPRASVVMSRATIEIITEEKGEATGRLVERLNRLRERGVLYPALFEWANEIRLMGNAGAHAELERQVTMDEASELVGFARKLVEYLYELPARLSRSRERRGSTG